MSEEGYVSPAFPSWAHVAMGETEVALDCLDRACQDRAPVLISLPGSRHTLRFERNLDSRHCAAA